MWGIILPYVNSYLLKHGQLTKSIINLGAPMLYLGDYMGTSKSYTVVTYSLDKKLGTRYTILLSMLICTTGFCLGGIWANSYFVVIGFGLLFGFGCGVLSISSLWPCWSHFGSTNAIITGIIVVGYSDGSGILGAIFTHLVNPHNYSPSGDQSSQLTYPDSVSSQVPYAFYSLAGITFVIGVISWLIISFKPCALVSEEHRDYKEPRSYKQILTSNEFLRLAVLTYFSSYVVNFWICDYKIIALGHLDNDHLAAYSYIMGSVAANIGQILWMVVLKYTSFKFVAVCINVLNSIFTVSFPLIWNMPVLFITWICAINLICGGFYPALIVETFKQFPGEEGKKTLPFMTFPWVVCTFTMTGITEIGDIFGYDIALYIISCMPIIAVLCITLWKQIQPLNNISKDSLDLSESIIN